MAGNSGYVDFSASNTAEGSRTLRVYWEEAVSDAPGAQSTVSIKKVQFSTSSFSGYSYFADFIIKINGQTAVTINESSWSCYVNNFNTFYDIKNGSADITGSVSGIAHNADGSKSVNITIHANNWSYPGLLNDTPYTQYRHPAQFTAGAAKSITLYTIPVGTLSISAGTGSTISVTRNGTALSAGAKLWYGQSLVISFGVSSGYTMGAHTVNGTTFTSGGTHSVTGNVAVVSTATRSVSTIATGNGTFGTTQTITVTRYVSAYTHTIVASCAGQTQTIATKSSSLSISWTPAVSIMNSITAAMSASCTLTCTTYNGNTSLGSSSITVTLALPTSGTYSVKPTPSITDSDANGYKTTFGGYVARKSVLSVAINDGLKYSATTASRSTTANGLSSGAASFNAGTLTGNTTISTMVKDSRGQTGTASKSITVLAYTSPSITTFAVRRTDSSGNPDDTGDYFTVSWAVAITALNNHNTRSLKLRYKRVSASSWTEQTITLSAYSDNGTTATIAASGDYSWDIQLVLADYFETVTKATKLSTAAVVESRYPGGTGVAFGKVAETSGLFDVKWNTKVHGGFAVGDNEKVRIFEDTEGGNIAIDPPNSAQGTVTSWQIDALGGYLRIFAALAGSGHLFPFTLNTNGSISNLGVVIGDSKRDFRDYGATYNGVTDTFYANAVYTYEGSNRFRVVLSGKLVPENSSSVYTIAPKSAFVAAINGLFGKSYTAIANYYGVWRSDPALSLANQGYGRVVMVAGDGTYFGLGRRYDTSGSEGAWAQSNFYNSGSGSMIDIDMVLELS